MGQDVEQIQQCPVFKGPANWFEDPYTGYNYNTSYIGRNETLQPVDSARTTEVRAPAQTALFGDGEYAGGANKFMRAPFSNPRDASLGDAFCHAGTQGFRHGEQTNVAYADSHVKSRSAIYTDNDCGAAAIAEGCGFLSADNSEYDLR